ncbi:putative gtpase activating protein [Schistosoma mansoni]|uniref:putative gtpase activating protein n=1 Tax=Schistosoma mansoni TaxID=6183 RepID=UPI0001A62745|nr:putative gtpase activating protein [Schistosoma mansoni]|eukprot:XP_018655272.1 putative gtpase activating protein [Schistosoma mansoni]
MTQSRPYFTYDIHPGRYTCISTFRRTPLSGEEYLDVIPGDILVVECRPQNATAPTSFLYGLNETTKHKGYFPAYCVDIREFGSLQLRSKSTDRIAYIHFLPNSQSIKATNVDPQSLSQPVIPPRCKRLLNLSSPSSLLSIPYNSYSHSCTNLSVSSQDILPHEIQKCNVSVPTLSYRCHQFVNVSVSYPLICNLCNDYIVTPRCNANRCFTCKSIFHLVCAEYSKRFEVFTCQPPRNDNSTIKSEKLTCSSTCNAFSLLSSSISTTEQPLVSWNCTQVAHWLAVVGLCRFVRLFIKLNLDGNFLSEVTYDSPHLCRVADPFARETLERAILKLDSNSKVPIFLTTCTEQIEKLATESFITASNNPCIQPVDMAMVYQQSALTYTLQELHNTFAHCLPLPDIEQSSTHPLDIVRFAQLMKAFLRDLPVNVIPEEYYLDFCSLANIRNIDEKEKAVHAFLESLPELHRLCLIHIFNHLGFVLNHQNKLKSYLSDSSSVNLNRSNSFSESSINVLNKATPWLMIFRQILVRPPWHLITDIAMGMDTHMRALEALFSTFVDFVSEESEYTSQTKNSEAQSHVLDSNLQRNYISFSQFEHISRYQGEKHTSSESISPYPTNVVAPTINTPPSPTSITANKKDLQNQEWYWGDITQEEVRELMTDLQDGYFLVRDASGSSSAAFTLVVRLATSVQHCLIHCVNGKYGFVENSCTYESLEDLICYYHVENLKRYNNLLNITLKYPIKLQLDE